VPTSRNKRIKEGRGKRERGKLKCSMERERE
jgi:hypothetical protein